MRNLPALESLRVFEYAARSLSFKAAAQELHLTPPAVSHRIRTLENTLGVKLFVRRPRAVTLTPEGADLFDAVSTAFGTLRKRLQYIERDNPVSVLKISAAPAFFSSWLMPRLAGFRRMHPDIEVRLDTSLALVDFDRSDIDLAIRFTAHPEQHGLTSHWLLPGESVVVCTPAIARSLQQPADLATVPLIHSATSDGDWQAWLKSAGLDAKLARKGPRFDNDTFALDAAKSGLGIAILHHSLVQPYLSRGDLVRPFEHVLAATHGYYLVHPEHALCKPSVQAFRAWLLSQFDQRDL